MNGKFIDEIKKENKIVYGFWCLIAAPIVIGLSITWLYIKTSSTSSIDQFKWGEFGDFFGGIMNPVIGITTLIFIYFTLVFTKFSVDVSKQNTFLAIESIKSQIEIYQDSIKQQASTESRARAFAMYQIWISTDFHKRRTEARETINDLKNNTPGNSVIFLGNLRLSEHVDDKNKYETIFSIFKFMADTNKTIDENLTDKNLMTILTESSFDEWFRILESASLRSNKGIHDPDFDNQFNWFITNIKPLAEKFARLNITNKYEETWKI